MWQIKSFAELSTAELFAIYKARTAVFVVEQHCPYQEVDDKDLIATHIFAKKGKDLTAYCRVIPSEDKVHIGRVLVAQSARGTGLARELMLQAVGFAKISAKPIHIQAQAYLQDFYQSLGFQAVSEIYLEDGIEHLDMVLGEK